MPYVKSFAAGLLGTALMLVAADYWTLRTTVANLNTWAITAAPIIQRIQQADLANARTTQEVHQPPAKKP